MCIRDRLWVEEVKKQYQMSRENVDIKDVIARECFGARIPKLLFEAKKAGVTLQNYLNVEKEYFYPPVLSRNGMMAKLPELAKVYKCKQDESQKVSTSPLPESK